MWRAPDGVSSAPIDPSQVSRIGASGSMPDNPGETRAAALE